MLPMDMLCPVCGWRYPAEARWCGQCGHPLATDKTVAAPVAAGTPTLVGNAAGPAAYARTNQQTEPARPTTWPPAGATRAAGSAGNGPDPKRRTGGQWWKGALAALAVVALILGVAAAAGEIFARPALHQAVDSHVKSALHQAVSQIPTPDAAQAKGGEPVHYRITAADVNSRVRDELSGNSEISDAQVQFVNGQIVVTVTAQGQQGTVTTELAIVDGRLQARNTQVSCPLCLVESNDEMQANLNDALNAIPPQYDVTEFSVGQDAIDVTVRIKQ